MSRYLTPEEADRIKLNRKRLMYALIIIATVGVGAGISALSYLM
ncbi:hypothetical protein [Falsibacillus albus]|nr:hypothetical protein [Falsibacillus albus]